MPYFFIISLHQNYNEEITSAGTDYFGLLRPLAHYQQIKSCRFHFELVFHFFFLFCLMLFLLFHKRFSIWLKAFGQHSRFL